MYVPSHTHASKHARKHACTRMHACTHICALLRLRMCMHTHTHTPSMREAGGRGDWNAAVAQRGIPSKSGSCSA